MGCGCGNTLIPLLQLNPLLTVHACDCSSTAVGLVQAHPACAASGRVHAFVADITQQDLTRHVVPGSVDFATLVRRPVPPKKLKN